MTRSNDHKPRTTRFRTGWEDFTSWERWVKLCVMSLCDYFLSACDKQSEILSLLTRETSLQNWNDKEIASRLWSSNTTYTISFSFNILKYYRQSSTVYKVKLDIYDSLLKKKMKNKKNTALLNCFTQYI